jgi:hypothetical protein
VTRLRAGWPGFDSRKGQDIFLLAASYGPSMWPTQPGIKWLPEVRFLGGVTLTTHLHLEPRSRKSGAIPPLPIRLLGVVLNKYEGQLYLYFDCIWYGRSDRRLLEFHFISNWHDNTSFRWGCIITLNSSECVKYWRRTCTAYTMFETLYVIKTYLPLFRTFFEHNLHLTKQKRRTSLTPPSGIEDDCLLGCCAV